MPTKPLLEALARLGIPSAAMLLQGEKPVDTIYPNDTAEMMANGYGTRIAKAKADWDAVKNELAALVGLCTAKGTHARGMSEAQLEDADTGVLMLLSECQSGITAWYAVEQ